jgi:hypothetical protein
MGAMSGERPNKSSCRRRACCLSGCLSLSILALVFVALLLLPPPAPSPLSPAEQARVEKRLESVRQEVEAIERDVRAGRSHPFSLTLTQQEINSLLSTDNKIRKEFRRHRVERAYVRIEEGRIQASATRRSGGVPVTVTATIVPVLQEDGSLDPRVEGLRVGRVGIPEAGVDRLAKRLVRAVRDRLLETRVQVESIRIENEAITVKGNTIRPGSRE